MVLAAIFLARLRADHAGDVIAVLMRDDDQVLPS